MPTTKLRNALYRARIAVPFRIPRLGKHPEMTALGTPLRTAPSYIRILRKHHVLGSAAILRNERGRAVLLTSSSAPTHRVVLDSFFRVASITKMATALAVMSAADEGKLSLSEPIRSYLPKECSIPESEGVTLKHLLSHTSGLRDPVRLEEALMQGVPLPRVLSGCRLSEPGSAFLYSNLGYGIIGCVLEAVYSLPVSEIMRRLVFEPLGMQASLDASTLPEDRIVPITRITQYVPGNDLVITPLGRIPLTQPDPLRHYGHTAGSMYLTIESLEKLVLCLMHRGAPLLRGEMGDLMREKHAEYGKISPTLSYGLGLLRIHDPAISDSLILGHQGFAYGCADGAFWEEQSGSIVLFLNGGASEARKGRLGLCNYDMLRWALQKEMPQWSR